MASRSEQINRNIKMINQFLMNQNLMGQRQKGYMGLESERHENMMTRLGEDFSNKIARDPVMERHRALIFKAQERGDDTTSLIEAMRKDAMEISKVAFTTATGQPWSPEVSQAATLLTEDALVKMGIQGARTGIAGTTAVLRGHEAITARKGVEAREGELKLAQDIQVGKDPKQYREDMIDLVKGTIDDLMGEGVQGEDVNATLRDLFGSGKILDPLSPEHRGKALTYLSEIWMKLIKNKTLTSNEENFLTSIRNTTAIQGATTGVEPGAVPGVAPGVEPGAVGGIPSPTTGLTPGQEGTAQNMINNRLIEMATKHYMELGKLDEATARQMAEKLISGLR